MTGNTEGEQLSADEIALYDRQLRLWGIEAQNRMRKAHILLINFKALGNEIAKNLVLAGIGSLTVLDADTVTEEDVATEFFVTEEDIGKNRAEASVEEIRRLNPRVNVNYNSSPITSQDPIFYKTFDVIIATDLPLSTMIQVNKHTRLHNVPFYAASLHGLCGIAFVDLIKHTLLPATASNSDQPVVPRQEIYCPLSQSLTTSYGKSLRPRQARKVSPLLPLGLALLSWLDSHSANPSTDTLQDFEKHILETITKLSLPDSICNSSIIEEFVKELEPPNMSGMAAVVGGVIGQDILNSLGGKELPIKNWLIFNGRTCEGRIYSLMGDTNGTARN